ncbi:MAG: aspartate kinase [Planctomycetota bacterium]|nr:MAG: aspartate kinase [Planctomycetota bacterium]
MSLIVQKFGGTSVGTPERILSAARRAVAAKRAGHQVVMVCSARGKKTDELIDLANEITATPQPREMDMLLSTGEQEAVALVAMAISTLGEPAISLTGEQIGIVTDQTYTKARISQISTDRLRQELNAGKIVVACGFQGTAENGDITTLGRGGSDTTATALAAALEADECEIYTDVDGVYTTDPRIVPDARQITRISYDEMLEMASLGAGVMHSRSIEFAKKFDVALRVRHSQNDRAGTLIASTGEELVRSVTGMALVRDEVRVSLCDIPDRPGVMSLIFAKMSARKIPVDMVVQNVSANNKAEVSFTVDASELAETLTAAQEAVTELGEGSIMSGTNLAKVSAVGAGMKHSSGVAARMFRRLADAGINIQMISTSDIKVSVLVDRNVSEQALRTVHSGFQLESENPAPELLAGLARVAATATAQANEQERLASVVSRLRSMEDIVVSEVVLDESQARVTVHNVQDRPGISAELFEGVANAGVSVDMIVQNVSRNSTTEVSFTVDMADLSKCEAAIQPLVQRWTGSSVSHEREIALLSVSGIGLRTHTGVGERMFKALAESKINVKMVNTSEIRMSVAVAQSQGALALTALRKAFALI